MRSMFDDFTFEEACRLLGARITGRQAKALCVAHDETDASLVITRGDQHNWTVRCWGGCSDTPAGKKDLYEEIEKVLYAGKPPPRQTDSNEARAWRTVATYDYPLIRGGVAHKLRQERPSLNCGKPEKKFVWWHDDNGRKVWRQGGPVGLYHQELLEAKPHAVVLLVEGEKVADAAIAHGFVAVSLPNGCKSDLEPHHLDALAGRDVVIIPDCDDQGRAAAQRWAQQLHDAR